MFLKAELYLFEIFILRVTYRLAGGFLHTLLVKSAGCPITIAIAKLRIGYIYSTWEIFHNFSTYEACEKLRVRGTHRMSFAVAYMVWTGKWEGDWRERRFPVPFPFRSFPPLPSPPPLRLPRRLLILCLPLLFLNFFLYSFVSNSLQSFQ